MLDRWIVIASGQKLVEEMRKCPDEELDNMDGLGQVRIGRLWLSILRSLY